MKNENIDARIEVIAKEFKKGFTFIEKYPKSISIFGSARLTPASSHYHDAQNLAHKIVSELDYAVFNGGGPGIMEAVSRGAREAGGKSVGIDIDLPSGERKNEYTNSAVDFHHFFVRKIMLTSNAEGFVFFPGGFGTFDELFEILTLIKTDKIRRVPVILFGKDFWNPFKEFMVSHMFNQHHTIEAKELDIFTITDSLEETIEILRKA